MAKSRYTAKPTIDPQHAPGFRTIIEILSGQLTVAEGARRLDMARQHLQDLSNRAETAVLEVVIGKPPGRPGKSEEQKALEKENAKLRAEVERLRRTTDSLDSILDVTAKWLRHDAREAGSRRAKTEPKNEGSDDPEPAAERLADAKKLASRGVPGRIAAAAVQISAPTLRRWGRRSEIGEPAIKKRGRRVSNTSEPDAEQVIHHRLNALHGRIGEESLRRAAGVSRRAARRIKARWQTDRERDRKAGAVRLRFTQAGIGRGFDPVFARVEEGRCFLMNVQDAAVPLHTTLSVCQKYDGPTVAALLEKDFEQHRAPLVLRQDRAKQNVTAEVRAVLERHGVLVLHGPPRYPRFYGQLERQNGELRRWLDEVAFGTVEELNAACLEKKAALNELWPRRSLGWRTAADVSNAMRIYWADRVEFGNEVKKRVEEVRRRAAGPERYAGQFERRAIEVALLNNGLMRLEPGGWVSGD